MMNERTKVDAGQELMTLANLKTKINDTNARRQYVLKEFKEDIQRPDDYNRMKYKFTLIHLWGGICMSAVAPKAPSSILSNFIEIFQTGITHVIKSTCSMDVKPGSPIEAASETNTKGFQLVASLGIISAKVKGNMALAYPESTFLAMASEALGETYTKITPDIADFGAELLNIVFGYCKTNMSAKYNIVFEPAIPSLQTGSEIAFLVEKTSHCMVIPVMSPKGQFMARISLSEGA